MFPSLDEFIPKGMDSIHITQHRKIVPVSNDYGSEPAPHLRNRIVHPLSDLTPDITTLCCQSLSYCLAQYDKIAFSDHSASVSKSQKIECFGSSLTSFLAILRRKATELNQAGFLWMQFQSKLGQSLPEKHFNSPLAWVRLHQWVHVSRT